MVLRIKTSGRMAEHNELGKWGEDYAAEYLQSQGYIILERDWHYGRSKRDIDIICKSADRTAVVFVEVKTRSHDEVVAPEFAVDRRKVRHIGKAADNYVKMNNIVEYLRFDIITIIGRKGGKDIKLNHIVDAFNPMQV